MRVPILACLIASVAATPAQALCFYNKKDFLAGKTSTTTISQEFRDSKWVVRARIEREQRHNSDNDESWVVYDVRPVTSYKGASRSRFRLFTYVDSGGFQPDVGVDYLLFLDPPTQDLPRGVRNVVQVNFSCGQSRPWPDVSRVDRRTLARLANRK
jgi:hypothetical protein